MLIKQISNQLKLLGLIILSLFLSVLLVLGSGFSGKSQEDDIVLGMSAAFTGASRSLGIELYRGSMAYIEDINRQGGINGKQIVIEAYDDGYNPTRAIQNTIKLIENDDVFLLFDYVGTPTVTRVLPLLKNYSDRQTYLFFPFTGAQPQRETPYEQFAFNLRASYRQETEGLVDNFVKINRPRIAVFYQIDAYGRSGWDGVRRALAKYGLTMVGEATYRRGTSYSQSLKRQVNILKAANPDAVISIGSYGACAGFIRDARDAGWNVPIANISFVGSESLLNLLLETGVKTGLDYTTNLINSQVVPSYNDTSLAAVSDYRALMDQYNPMPPSNFSSAGYKPLRYSFVSLEGFLNAKLLVVILQMMGDKVDKARLRQAVEKVKNLDLGINAPVSFSAFRNQGLNNVYYTTVEQGQFLPLDSWERLAK